jgi:hypothetical protein
MYAFFVCALLGGFVAEDYNKILIGMTKEEVMQILGGPPVDNVTDADRYSRTFSMSSYHIREIGKLWRSGKLQIWVVFDENNQVTGKMRAYAQQKPRWYIYLESAERDEVRPQP